MPRDHERDPALIVSGASRVFKATNDNRVFMLPARQDAKVIKRFERHRLSGGLHDLRLGHRDWEIQILPLTSRVLGDGSVWFFIGGTWNLSLENCWEWVLVLALALI